MATDPLVIFDGHCGFCRIWIEYWKALTGGRLRYSPSQEVGQQYPQIPKCNFSQSLQLVLPNDTVLSGARAVFTTLTYASGMSWLLWIYEQVPGFALISEAAYRFVAGHRTFFYHLTRLTFGQRIQPLVYVRTEWLFVRLLAAIYLMAFGSLGMQVRGLIGAHGVLPVGRYLAAVSSELGARGYWEVPTVFWLAHSDGLLLTACVAGAVIALVVMAGVVKGVWERGLLIGLYLLYLFLCSVGQDFLAFQWDSLLLETGFLAIFLGNSKVVVWLFRWLLFRLTFLSGIAKLASHDVPWRDGSAVAFHYLTQPLPTPLAWYMYQLPFGFQRFSTAAVLFIELVVPFLFFAPRPWRLAAAWTALFLQVMIAATGNYTFFNLLTMSLCLFLFDDGTLRRLPLRVRSACTLARVAVAAAVLVLALSISEFGESFFARDSNLVRIAAPFQIVNTYGLFETMTTTRPEIIVEGSNDGVAWTAYEFGYKPGNVAQAPRWVAPYQPRLDWQMWFAALSNYRATPWFTNLMLRLLEGSPDVLTLLAQNPFPNMPPKYVRAELFVYSFTNIAERRRTGNWWKREWRGDYFPAVTLKAGLR